MCTSYEQVIPKCTTMYTYCMSNDGIPKSTTMYTYCMPNNGIYLNVLQNIHI